MARETEPALRGLLVRAARCEADGVLGLELVDPTGADLPAWRPGAHLDLHLPSAWSVSTRCAATRRTVGPTGSPSSARSPAAVVRRRCTTPHWSAGAHRRRARNHFELVEATCYVFIAGGIGITPILRWLPLSPSVA